MQLSLRSLALSRGSFRFSITRDVGDDGDSGDSPMSRWPDFPIQQTHFFLSRAQLTFDPRKFD